MIDATGAQEQWQEAVYNLLMISFCILTLVYIWQRWGANCEMDRQILNKNAKAKEILKQKMPTQNGH